MTDVSVLMCFDKNYLKHGLSVILQILTVSKLDSLFIFTDEDSHEEVERAASRLVCNSEMNEQVQVSVISADREMDSRFYCQQNVNKWKVKISDSTYWRLYASRFIDKDRVLYLDSDISVYGDLSELFEMDMNHEIAAVQDFNSMHRPEDNAEDNDKSFNAGVLLMDLKSMRETDFIDNVIKKAESVNFDLEWEDQTLLNMYYGKDIDWLPLKWNWHRMNTYMKSEGMLDDVVIQHFVSKVKPWSGIEVEDMSYFYRFMKFEEKAVKEARL